MRSCPSMHASHTILSAQHARSTDSRSPLMSDDIWCVVAEFLELFDLRRLRIVSAYLKIVTKSPRIWRIVADRRWPYWSDYHTCPIRAMHVYAQVAMGKCTLTRMIRQEGPVACNASSVVSADLNGHVTMRASGDAAFQRYDAPVHIRHIVVLDTGDVVVASARLMQVFGQYAHTDMWIPGQVKYLRARYEHSWYAITIDGSLWQCSCLYPGLVSERTHVAMLASPREPPAGSLTCVTQAADGAVWPGTTVGVTRALTNNVWTGCKALDIESTAQYVVAAMADKTVRMWNNTATAMRCTQAFTMPYYALSAFSTTDMVTYGPMAIEADTGRVYGSATTCSHTLERKYTHCGTIGVFCSMEPTFSRFVQNAT